MRSRQMLTITYQYILFVLSLYILFFNIAFAKDATAEQTQINELLSAVKLQRPGGCVELMNHMFTPERIKGLTAINPGYGICKNGLWREARLPGGVAEIEIASATNHDMILPAEISETNNQEKLVQESDIVKTDVKGNLYIASTQYLYIVKGFPADTFEAATNKWKYIRHFLDFIQVNQAINVNSKKYFSVVKHGLVFFTLKIQTVGKAITDYFSQG